MSDLQSKVINYTTFELLVHIVKALLKVYYLNKPQVSKTHVQKHLLLVRLNKITYIPFVLIGKLGIVDRNRSDSRRSELKSCT